MPQILYIVFSAIILASLLVFLLRHWLNRPRYSARRLSPQEVVQYMGSDEEELSTPEQLSRSITERADEIYRTMLESPSEIQIEMCALGYRICVEDMITLTQQINQELRTAGPIRRTRLRLARRRAVDSLSHVREALPPSALRATRQSQ